MTSIIRRTFLLAIAAAPVLHVASVHAVEALPDARFVGFAETVNDFEIRSSQLALAKSSNEVVRGYATRAVAEHTTAAQTLAKNRAEAGVSMAPDEDVRKISDDAMLRLNSLQGVAEVLPENVPMLKVFERCGLAMTTRSERGVVHVTLALSQLAKT